LEYQEQIDYWLNSAGHDLETAESLYSAAKYDWCLFLGHIVLEKALKAAYVMEHENELPPRTHNLVRLIQETSIPADEDKGTFLMDKITPEVRDLVNQYLKKLADNNIHVERALVFGSQAKGGADRWSDIDVAIISKDFEGVRYKDKDKIRKITLSVSPMISPLPFRTQDFSESDPLVKHIVKTGTDL
jgi:predicted nucleotidyltransferase